MPLLRLTADDATPAPAGPPRWPQPGCPSFSRRYALGWNSFPVSFEEDCGRFLYQSVNQDVFADDDTPPIRPSTIDMRRKQLLQLGTALILAGVPAASITGLAALVAPENAKLALRYFRERPGGKASQYLHQHAALLKTIALHWVKAPTADVDILRGYASRVAIRQTGMVEKNRARMRQFDDRRTSWPCCACRHGCSTSWTRATVGYNPTRCASCSRSLSNSSSLLRCGCPTW